MTNDFTEQLDFLFSDAAIGTKLATYLGVGTVLGVSHGMLRVEYPSSTRTSWTSYNRSEVERFLRMCVQPSDPVQIEDLRRIVRQASFYDPETDPTKALAGAKQATNNEALAWLGWALHIVRDRCPDVLTSHQYDCAEQAYKSGFDPSWRAKDEVLARENEDLKRRLAELEKQQPVNERLVEALLYWRDECRGAEPSLSVFARMADEALAAAEAQQAEPVNECVIDRTWVRFCGAFGDGPDAPYPGMIEAFEAHYGQSFRDKDWRTEAACWAAAWHKAVLVAAGRACAADDSDRVVVEIREAVLQALGPVEGAEPLKAEPVPVEAIGRLLTEAMDKAVENGASSVSMPDDYVAVAAWLCRVEGADNG